MLGLCSSRSMGFSVDSTVPFNKNGLEGAAAARKAAVVPLACPWSRAPIRRHLQAAPWQYAPDVAASAVHARGAHRGLRLLGGVQLPGCLFTRPLEAARPRPRPVVLTGVF